MKKTIKRPDGTLETVEGTPEELAAYEQQLSNESKKPHSTKDRRKLLTEVAEEIKDIIQKSSSPVHFCTGCHICMPFWIYRQPTIDLTPIVTWTTGVTCDATPGSTYVVDIKGSVDTDELVSRVRERLGGQTS